MTTRKKITIAVSIVILIGIAGAVYLFPMMNTSSSLGGSGTKATSEEDMRILLLEYADHGLTYEADTKTFYYDGQLVKKLDDSAYFHTNADGTVQVSVSRDNAGKIVELTVK